jgi:hypothetical protein
MSRRIKALRAMLREVDRRNRPPAKWYVLVDGKPMRVVDMPYRRPEPFNMDDYCGVHPNPTGMVIR